MKDVFKGDGFCLLRNAVQAAEHMLSWGDLPEAEAKFLEGYVWCFKRMVRAIEKDEEEKS